MARPELNDDVAQAGEQDKRSKGMCRAFAADLDWDDVAEHFGVCAIDADDADTGNTVHHCAAALPSPTFHTAPKTDIAIVAGDSQGRRHLRAAYWSLIPKSSKTIDLSYPTYNARIETAASRPTYAPSAASMRAIIPASGYYEFKGEHPYYFHASDDVPLFMAGLYSWWRTSAHVPWRLTATILTREAIGAPASVHSRMPVLLPDDMIDDWFAPLANGGNAGANANAASLPATANAAIASLLAEANDAGGKLSQRLVFHEIAPLHDDGPQLVEPVPRWHQGSGLFA
jgi:putative SOS response-associated peptidase YedK